MAARWFATVICLLLAVYTLLSIERDPRLPDYKYDNRIVTRSIRYSVTGLDLVAAYLLLRSRRLYAVWPIIGALVLSVGERALVQMEPSEVADKYSPIGYANAGVFGAAALAILLAWILWRESAPTSRRGFPVR